MASSDNPRDVELARRYLNESISVERLALEVGLSTIRVKQILKAQGVTKEQRSPLAKIAEDRSLSPRHVRIGKQVAHYRSFNLSVDRTFFAQEIGWSTTKLSSVEKGTFNLTLIDLDDIARTLGKPLHVLLEASEVASSPAKGDVSANDPGSKAKAKGNGNS